MDNAEMIWFLQNLVIPLVRGNETDGRFTLIQMDGPPGDQPPLHVHRDSDDGVFVLTGQLTLWTRRAASAFRLVRVLSRLPRGSRTPTA